MILATTACGSLREEIAPGHVVVLDSFIDRSITYTNLFYFILLSIERPIYKHQKIG
jgi:purine nucleoside phosphorylase